MHWEIETKLPINNKRDLSLVYTPGVGQCCLEIKNKKKMAMELTNKANSVAVFAMKEDQKAAQEKASSLRQQGYDAYPIILQPTDISIPKIIKSLEPTFATFDIELIKDNIKESANINTELPEPINFVKPEGLPEDIKEASVKLHYSLKGIIKQKKCSHPEKLVGVISNGSAVLGFGNIGADAALPVMEGKAALFKKFGNISAIPICINSNSVDEFIKIIKAMEPTFDGINLEDICAPDCFTVEDTLIKSMNIPIFHDDQHGTAIVVLSGIINALTLINKAPENAKVVMSGAGAAAQAVAKLLLKFGIKDLTLTDINGIVYKGRPENDFHLDEMAKKTNPKGLKGMLKDAIKDADIFIGLSAQGVLKPEMIKEMAQKPIIFALANPNPEIMPDEAKTAGAYIVATGRSDFPNQVNNSLAFPGVFKGILQTDKKEISDEIKLESAKALAAHVKVPSVDNIIPDALDKQVPDLIAQAIIRHSFK